MTGERVIDGHPMDAPEVAAVLARFNEKWEPIPFCGCWIWTAADTRGYGMVQLRRPRRTTLAHRLNYELLIGPIPAGLQLLHKCDTPPCVNPDHLYLGTDQDNRADMARRRRGARGVMPYGVYRSGRGFGVKVDHRRKSFHLGFFATVEAAAARAEAWRREVYGSGAGHGI